MSTSDDDTDTSPFAALLTLLSLSQYKEKLEEAVSDAVFKSNAAGPSKNMALSVLEDAMGGEVFRAGKRDDGARPPRGPEVADLFQFKGVPGAVAKQAESAALSKAEEDEEAERIAMQRGTRRQVSARARSEVTTKTATHAVNTTPSLLTRFARCTARRRRLSPHSPLARSSPSGSLTISPPPGRSTFAKRRSS